MDQTVHGGRVAALRDRLRTRQAARQERKTLANELAAYTTRSDLIDLSALLERYDDRETESIRRAVDWSRAA